jgi:hypothetical protein
MNNSSIYVRNFSVVEVLGASPMAAIESSARVAESVVDSAVETNGRPPVTDVPDVKAFRKSPIPGCPKKTGAWREHPSAGNPIETFIAIGPIAGFPDITRTRANRLNVNRKDRGSNTDTDNKADSRNCSRPSRDAEKSNSQNQGAENNIDSHITHLSKLAGAYSPNAITDELRDALCERKSYAKWCH